jgi:Ca2+-binding RTX toxin-like protein
MRFSAALVAALAAALALPSVGVAAPGSAGVSGATLLFQAGPGTTNSVRIERGQALTKIGEPPGFYFLITDGAPGATVEPATGCRNASDIQGLSPGSALCFVGGMAPSPVVRRVRVLLGDGSDSVSLVPPQPPLPPGGPFITPATISAGLGDDRVTAGDGADQISGGPGVNTVRAGGGNDQLLMRNGVRDTLIDCGDGIDTAVVDKIDPRPIACETVLRPR